MAYKWTIQKAAVEEEILFPNRKCYMEYLAKVTRQGKPLEVVSSCSNPDGTVNALIRKQYNPYNAFLRGIESNALSHRNELTAQELRIDRDMQIDSDEGTEILAFVECWFDAEGKFGLTTVSSGNWLNMYARYNPFCESIWVEFEVCNDSGTLCSFEYVPSKQESDVLIELIRARIWDIYHITPQEFLT